MPSANRHRQAAQPDMSPQVTNYGPRLPSTEQTLEAAFTPKSSPG